MLFRHFTNPHFCDILYTEGKREIPGKQNQNERGNQNEKRNDETVKELH